MRAVDDEAPPPRRHFREDGAPNFAELAYTAVSHMHMSKGHEASKWGTAALAHSALAQREAMEDLARSNRELAAAMNRVADQRERSS